MYTKYVRRQIISMFINYLDNMSILSTAAKDSWISSGFQFWGEQSREATFHSTLREFRIKSRFT